MKEIAVFEAKTRLSELLAAVEEGEQFTITRRGRPIARLVAAATPRRESARRQQVATVIAGLRTRCADMTLDGDIREVIAEGRD